MQKQKNTNRYSSSNSALYLGLGGLLGITMLSGTILASTRANAATDVVDDVSIEVPISCSMSGTGMNTHNATLMNGIYSGGTEEYSNGIGSTTLSVLCNDNNGFSIYAIGYTNNEEGNNTLKGANTNITIPTGIYTSGTTTNSTWSMKITEGTDSGDTQEHPLTIDNDFDDFHTVPGEQEGYTKIAHKTAATAMSGTPSGATLTTTYDAYISTTQAADTYTGQVKYVMVHPYDHAAPEIPHYMYVYNSSHDDIMFENLTVSSYNISDDCVNLDFWWTSDNEQKAIYCSGGDAVDEWEDHHSIQSEIIDGGFASLYREGIVDNVKVDNVPGAASNYNTLGSDVFVKYNQDNFMEQYICTMYKAEERGGKPFCFEPDDEGGIEPVVSLFGQENCDSGGPCEIVDDNGFWYCDSVYCAVSKSSGGYGASIHWGGFEFPEPRQPAPDDIIYYDGKPLSIYYATFWQQLKISCENGCSKDMPLDSRITIEKIDNDSAYFYIKPYATNDLRMKVFVGITHDPETYDPRVEIGEPFVDPDTFDYTQFTYHDSPLTSKSKLIEALEEYAYPWYKDLIGSFDAECIQKLINDYGQ